MQWYKQQSKTKQAGVGCLTVVIAMWLLGAILGSGDDAPPVAVTPAEDTPAADAPADEPAATDAPTDPPATTQTPAAEAPGDAGEPSTIPGLAAVDIYGNLETRGFTCERGSTSEGFGIFSTIRGGHEPAQDVPRLSVAARSVIRSASAGMARRPLIRSVM